MAFTSSATNLVPGDTNRESDVFVRDLEARRTVRVSVSSSGAQGDSFSFGASISADGRLVAFVSWASNLVARDTNHCVAVAEYQPNCGDVFVHDMNSGKTSRVSVSTSGRQANQRSELAVISANGRFVAFTSWATTLVPNDTNECSDGGGVDEPDGCPDAFVRDLVTHTTERVSVAADGAQFDSRSADISISNDGSKIAIRTTSGPAQRESALYVRDRSAGTTIRVPTPEGVSTQYGQHDGVLTGNGREAIYMIDVGRPPGCQPWSGEPICTGYTDQMYVYNLVARTNERITPRSTSGDAPNGDLHSPVSSSDGRYVLFSSEATNLVRGDRNGKIDVFLFDRVRKTVVLVSVSSSEAQGNGDSPRSALSGGGREAFFYSEASNLVRGDTNRSRDVFVRDLSGGATSRVSIA